MFIIIAMCFFAVYDSYFKGLFQWHKERERFSIEEVKSVTFRYYHNKEYVFLLNNEEKHKVLHYIRDASFSGIGNNNTDGISLTGGIISIEWNDGKREGIPWEGICQVHSRYQGNDTRFYLKSEELNGFIYQKTIHIPK